MMGGRAALATIAFLTAITIAGAVSACARPGPSDGEDQEEMSAKSIEEVLEEHTEEWMAVPGVVGTGIGRCDGEPCIRVFVVERTAEIEQAIPSEVEGYAVDIEETGQVRARDSV